MPRVPALRLLWIVWTTMSLLAVAHVVLFASSILRAADSFQVQFTPDDAYYYLGLARNFVRTGAWTFDSGMSITSGFHPLLAYLLALIYRATQPSTEAFVRYGLLLSSSLALVIALVAGYVGLKQKRYPHYLLFLALILSSRNYAINAVSIMEWSLALLSGVLYTLCFYRALQAQKRAYVTLLGLGLAGSVSRSDFGLFPFALFAATLLLFVFWRDQTQKQAIRNAFFGLVGATLGVALIFVHNQLFTGNPVQSSALMKVHWSQISGPSFGGTSHLLTDALGWTASNTVLLMVVGVLAIALAPSFLSGIQQFRRRWDKRLSNQGRLDLLLMVGATITLVGYVLVYSRNGDVQLWYTANFFIPLFLLLVIGYRTLGIFVAPRIFHFVTIWLTIAVLGLMGRNIASLYAISPTLLSPWPHQMAMLEAGKFLHQTPPEGRVGAWNAGIMGYYQGGTLINLDGLVNDSIYEYAISNTLPAYVEKTAITYIVDFEPMLTGEKLRVRGGYDDEAFVARLQPVKEFIPEKTNEWKNLILYKVLP